MVKALLVGKRVGRGRLLVDLLNQKMKVKDQLAENAPDPRVKTQRHSQNTLNFQNLPVLAANHLDRCSKASGRSNGAITGFF